MASQQQQLSADQRCGYEPLVGVPKTMSEDLLGEDPDAPSLMIRGNASYCVPESMFEDAGGIPDGCYPLTVVQYQMLRRQEARQLLEKSEQATKRRESSPSAAAAAPDTRAAKMEQMATPRRSLHLDGNGSPAAASVGEAAPSPGAATLPGVGQDGLAVLRGLGLSDQQIVNAVASGASRRGGGGSAAGGQYRGGAKGPSGILKKARTAVLDWEGNFKDPSVLPDFLVRLRAQIKPDVSVANSVIKYENSKEMIDGWIAELDKPDCAGMAMDLPTVISKLKVMSAVLQGMVSEEKAYCNFKLSQKAADFLEARAETDATMLSFGDAVATSWEKVKSNYGKWRKEEIYNMRITASAAEGLAVPHLKDMCNVQCYKELGIHRENAAENEDYHINQVQARGLQHVMYLVGKHRCPTEAAAIQHLTAFVQGHAAIPQAALQQHERSSRSLDSFSPVKKLRSKETMVQCPKVRRALWVLGGVLYWEAQTEADAAAQLSESKLGNMHPLVASVCGIESVSSLKCKLQTLYNKKVSAPC